MSCRCIVYLSFLLYYTVSYDLETLYYWALLIYFAALTFVTSHVSYMGRYHNNIFYHIPFLQFAVLLRYFRWTLFLFYFFFFYNTIVSGVCENFLSLITKYCTITISFQVVRRCPERILPKGLILQYPFIKFGTSQTPWKGFIFSP